MSTAWGTESAPSSIELWKKQSEYFWALDFKDEAKFKQELSSYYLRIYTGELRTRMLEWIERGNLESEYYSSHYSDLRDMKIGGIKKYAKNKYRAQTLQSSCYSLDYNPPDIDTIVSTYRVKNYTQKQVDAWHKSMLDPRYPGLPAINAEVCLTIHRDILLSTNPKNGLVEKEEWSTKSSTLVLKPEKAPKQP